MSKWVYLIEAIIFLCFFISYPFVIQQLIPCPPYTVVFIPLCLIFVFVLIGKKGIKLEKSISLIFIGQGVFYLLSAIIHSDIYYFYRIFYLIFTWAVLSLLNKKYSVDHFIKVWNYIVTTMVVCGVAAFFLALFDKSLIEIPFQNIDSRPATCFGLTCSNAIIGNMIRFAGYFDEPGAMAFWGVFSLIFNKLFIKNIKIELCLVIGLLFTFSMAYYIQLALYFMFFYRHKIKIITPVIIACICILVYINKSQNSNYELYRWTLERFERNSSGKIETNRDDMMVAAKRTFQSSPIMGRGENYVEHSGIYMSDNPYETLAKDGIIGYITVYFPLFYVMLKSKKRKELMYGALILFVGYQQRPFHTYWIHYMMLYSFLILSIKEFNNRRIIYGKI